MSTMTLTQEIIAAVTRTPDMGMKEVCGAVGQSLDLVRPILEELVDRNVLVADYYGDPCERRYKRKSISAGELMAALRKPGPII